MTPRSSDAPSPNAKLSASLESVLSSVMEQDGVVMNTPEGVRRRQKKTKRSSEPSRVAVTSQAPAMGSDKVASMDREIVNVHVGKGGGIPTNIAVRKGEHVRSPYVVSLQNIVLSQPKKTVLDERSEQTSGIPLKRGTPFSYPVEAYAAVSSDLMTESDPWMGVEQFTPASFEEAYRAVYGRFDRFRVFFREISSLAVGAVQKVERVEAQAAEDVREAMGVMEVRRFSFARAIAAFAGLALVVTLPANAVTLYKNVSQQKSVATNLGAQAVGSLVAAKDASSLPESAKNLRLASTQFRNLDAALADTNALAVGLASVLPNQYRSARALADVGDTSSEAARLIALGFDKVFSDPGRRLDERLDVLGAYANSALRLLSDASKSAATVDAKSLPAAQREKVTTLLSKLDESTQGLREFVGLSDVLSRMSGRDSLRKYLLIFQNPTELRPTGGFMGSFAEITLDRGAVTSIRVPPGGTYDLKGQLLARVQPPQPLQLVSQRWQFQDANWSPDFPTAAKKIRWFWSQSGQSTVDGVIAVNATFVEKLLAITGPIDMPEYGKTIDASNFMFETQKAVELEYDKKANTPKKIIGDLSTKLVERMKAFKKEDWLKVASLMSDSLETKDIQLALSRPDEESLAERYGWNGRIKDGIGDALALVEANVAGQKTDGVISETVDHHVEIRNDGSIQDTVTLKRTHAGKKGDLFSGVRNVSYLRTYVPKGSELLSATGFSAPAKSLFKAPEDATVPDADVGAVEAASHANANGMTISEEGERAVFGGWLQLDPGESQTITLSYRLPFTLNDIVSQLEASPERPDTASTHGAYLLLLTSQSGKTNRTITTTVTYPDAWNVSWSRPADVTQNASSVRFAETWDRDRTLALFFTPAHGQTTQK